MMSDNVGHTFARGPEVGYNSFCGIRSEEIAAPTNMADMTVEELKQRLDRGDDLFVLDVREPNEYQICQSRRTPDSAERPARSEWANSIQAGKSSSIASWADEAQKPSSSSNSRASARCITWLEASMPGPSGSIRRFPSTNAVNQPPPPYLQILRFQ